MFFTLYRTLLLHFQLLPGTRGGLPSPQCLLLIEKYFLTSGSQARVQEFVRGGAYYR